MSINKDTIVAIFLLLFCGIMINSSFDIEDVNDALARMKANEHFGKIILTLS